MTAWDALADDQRAHTDGFATCPFWLMWRGFMGPHRENFGSPMEPELLAEDWSAQFAVDESSADE